MSAPTVPMTPGTQPPAAPPPESTPLAGRFGRYEIERMLGRGGMGAVYLAKQTDLERPAVVKVIAPELAKDPAVVERLQREAKAAARVNSDFVVKVYETGVVNGIPFIAMEFVDGFSAAGILEKRGRLPWTEATKLVHAAAKGLKAAHDVGILHRDVKPANILITKDGRVKVADFGLAKFEARGPSAPAGTTLSMAGMILGTPEYMAPEQAEAQELDARADVYALGVTWYELLTGKRPFRGSSPIAVLSAALTTPPPPPREIVPELPEAVERACLALMARHKEDRPATTQAAVELIQQILLSASGSGPIAVPASMAAVKKTGSARLAPSLATEATRIEPPPSTVTRNDDVDQPEGTSRAALAAIGGVSLVVFVLGFALVHKVLKKERDAETTVATAPPVAKPADPEPEPKPADPKPEPKPEPKVEPKPEPRPVEAKVDPKPVEPKPEPRVEAKPVVPPDAKPEDPKPAVEESKPEPKPARVELTDDDRAKELLHQLRAKPEKSEQPFFDLAKKYPDSLAAKEANVEGTVRSALRLHRDNSIQVIQGRIRTAEYAERVEAQVKRISAAVDAIDVQTMKYLGRDAIQLIQSNGPSVPEYARATTDDFAPTIRGRKLEAQKLEKLVAQHDASETSWVYEEHTKKRHEGLAGLEAADKLMLEAVRAKDPAKASKAFESAAKFARDLKLPYAIDAYERVKDYVGHLARSDVKEILGGGFPGAKKFKELHDRGVMTDRLKAAIDVYFSVGDKVAGEKYAISMPISDPAEVSAARAICEGMFDGVSLKYFPGSGPMMGPGGRRPKGGMSR